MSKILDSYLVTGRLNGLQKEDAAEVYKQLCEAYNLDSRLRPFEVIEFQGSVKLYFSKAGCDALAARNNLKRTIKEITIDDDFQATCEVVVSNGDREENDFSFRFLGKTIPCPETRKPKIVALQGKELALEKTKLISSAKRRATLSFVGATIGMAEDTQTSLTPIIEETKKEEADENILPTPKKEVKKEVPAEVKKETVEEVKKEAPAEVKKEAVEALKLEVKTDLKEIAKDLIKERWKTQKNFKEETGKKIEDLITYLENKKGDLIIEDDFFEEEKIKYDININAHKLKAIEIYDALCGTDWKKDDEKIKAVRKFLGEVHCNFEDLQETIETKLQEA
jgi:hypothetical protein